MVTLTLESDERFRIPVPNRLRYVGVSTPKLMGTDEHAPPEQSKTGAVDCCPFTPTRAASAAATPLPLASAVNNPGAMFCTLAVLERRTELLPFVTVNLACPGAVPAGISKLICVEET